MADHDCPCHPDNELRHDESQHVDEEEHDQPDGKLHHHEERELEGSLRHPPHAVVVGDFTVS